MFSSPSDYDPYHRPEADDYFVFHGRDMRFPKMVNKQNARVAEFQRRPTTRERASVDVDRLLSASAFSEVHRNDDIHPRVSQQLSTLDEPSCPLHRHYYSSKEARQERDDYYPFMLFPQEARGDRSHGQGLFHHFPAPPRREAAVQRPHRQSWSDVVQHMEPPMQHQPLTATTGVENTSAMTNETSVGNKTPTHSVKLLAESLSFLSLGKPDSPVQLKYPVLKISNIPWSISMSEIQDILGDARMPDTTTQGQAIHVMINKTTGKTLSDAYVELLDQGEIEKAIRRHRKTLVKGRKLFITKSSQDDLMHGLFAEWPGKFRAGQAELPSTHHSSVPPPLILRKEFESLLAICRNFKLHFSRKCGERPFEHFISLLVKFPWDQPHIITTLQRDHLYEYYKLATGILTMHVSKPHTNLDSTLLARMIRAALLSPGLTLPQKKGIMTASGMDCPQDLTHYLDKPPEAEDACLSGSLLKLL